MEKLELIVKPTQSGKTFIMLQEIAKMLENNDDTIHIIFCDNQLLQTEQTSNRLDKYEDLETYVSEEGDISLILSSKSKIKKYTELTHHICGNLKTIITCSNKKRVEQIDKLIEYFLTCKKLNEYKFSIWIDEIDKNINLFKTYLHTWDKHTKVERIGLITATPNDVLKEFKILKIFELEKTYDRDLFHSFSDSEFKLLNINDIDIDIYIEKVIDTFSNVIKDGQVWFIPGEVNLTSHNNIKDILLKKDFIVIIINSNCKKIFYNNNNNEDLNNENNDNLCDVFGELYINKNLHLKKIAITGNLCVNRGITINSNKMLITHAIFPTKINNPSNSYQLAGRICGNIKTFINYKKPTIFCSLKFKNMIIDMENRAKNLAEKAFSLKTKFVNLKDYHMANTEICNKGIPILLTLTKDDISIINKIKKLSKKTRIQIENIIKKCTLTNNNIDFDIHKFKLRNKYSINKIDVDEKGKSKYEYQNFMEHYKNKKSKEPNKNCCINEYLLYIITEDINVWNLKAGHSIIIYKTN